MKSENPTSNDSRLAANPVDAPSWPTEDEIRRRVLTLLHGRQRMKFVGVLTRIFSQDAANLAMMSMIGSKLNKN